MKRKHLVDLEESLSRTEGLTDDEFAEYMEIEAAEEQYWLEREAGERKHSRPDGE